MNTHVRSSAYTCLFLHRFKRTSVGLAGSRSISEDSIFKPEQTKEQPIGVLHGTAVSMERINSDFQVRNSMPADGNISHTHISSLCILHHIYRKLDNKEINQIFFFHLLQVNLFF